MENNKIMLIAHPLTSSLQLQAMLCNHDNSAILGCGSLETITMAKVEVYAAMVVAADSVVVLAADSTVKTFFGLQVNITDAATNAVAVANSGKGYPGQWPVLAVANKVRYAFAGYMMFGAVAGEAGAYPSFLVSVIEGPDYRVGLVMGSLTYPEVARDPIPVQLTLGTSVTVALGLAPRPSSLPTFGCLNLPVELATMPVSWDATRGELTMTPPAPGLFSVEFLLYMPARAVTVDMVVYGVPAQLNAPRAQSVTPSSVVVEWDVVSNEDELGGATVVYTVRVLGLDGRALPSNLDAAAPSAVEYPTGTERVLELSGLAPSQQLAVAVKAESTGFGGGYSAWALLSSGALCTAPGAYLPPTFPRTGPCAFCLGDDYTEAPPAGAGAGSSPERCAPCPLLTTAPAFSSTIANCSCVPGAWARRIAVPWECEPCPPGGECSGGLARPRAVPGYFDVNGDGTVLAKCPRATACLAGGGCAVGYSGVLCSECADEYYVNLATGGCVRCPKSSAAVFGSALAVLILGTLGVLAGIFHLAVFPWEVTAEGVSTSRARKVPHSISVGLVFLQILGVLSSIPLRWPESVSRTLGIFRLLNIDIKVATSECSITSFYSMFLLTAALPLVGLFLHVCGVCLAFALPPLSGYVQQTRGAASVGLWRLLMLSTERLVCVVGPVMYIGMAQATLSYFDCSQFPDGKFYLDASPGTQCVDSEWLATLPVALLATGLYVVGLPIFLATVLWKRVRGRVRDEATLARYGTIFMLYRRPLFFYELILLGKRLLVVVVALFFSSQLLVQISILLFIFQLSMLAQLKLRPYYREVYNALETRLNVAVSFLLLFGLCFYVDKFPNEGSRIVFAAVAFVVVATCLVLVGQAIVAEARMILADRRLAQAGLTATSTLNERERVFLPLSSANLPTSRTST
ncbi:uncharacterized protein AMSG_10376 [Thecamonas trahens ATCC 50062]|uniref:Fibronectin type-III domain-containing protein n=1 Tax=Thecamonas trahens ATCC 50062 TaxID=461836 RepID=A0A0L0DQI3_THETB|nr:hypothetical protein AMSG_10376 [Thecamonas trahens ATCC 50062]KNC54530.1 hypothetical protein AMSG_10376 [Thecamonas trahens ATCC 50062]|eukprot:XP_013753547.1 hypothetical protein AMSG_10376 [Thecamonas trahens ATCC 50062]